MWTKLSLTAIGLALCLAAAGPGMAADPAGGPPSTRRPPDPGPQSLPLPIRTPGPTGQGFGLLAPPDLPGDPSDDAALDTLIGVFGAPPGSCDGLIPCCNTAQDAGCEFVSFDIACVEAGGFIQIDVLPDGSETYSCPAP